MKLSRIAEAIHASLVSASSSAGTEIEIDRVYAGDRVSDLLDQATPSTLIVTNLASRQLLKLAELMDVPAICFLNGQAPDEAIVEAAREHGTALIVSPEGMFATCGRIWAFLRGSESGGESP